MSDFDVARLYAQVKAEVQEALKEVFWAEDEINAAMCRHPAEGDVLFHSSGVLVPTHRLMATEFVYRSHCRELLERVAHGEDTRPGTAAEVCCLMGEISLHHPLKTPAVGLYVRMWSAAGFPDNPFGDSSRHYEALARDEIDELEAFARRKLTVKGRKLGTITCAGTHHGEIVQCKYATATSEHAGDD